MSPFFFTQSGIEYGQMNALEIPINIFHLFNNKCCLLK